MSTVETLSPKQVAQALGVSEASLKRWCDRGRLESLRTAGGHRRISVSSVIRYLRENGQPLIKPELLGLPTATGHGEVTAAKVRELAHAALIRGDEQQFRRTVFNMFLAPYSACDIFDQVLAPAMHLIGVEWAHGSMEVFQERRACEMCLRLIHELRAVLPPLKEDAPVAIGAALSDDRYVLAPAMADAALREAGWNAEHYGVHLPAASVCTAIAQRRPRLVWISAGYIADAPRFRSDIEKIHLAAQGIGAALALGGRAIVPELRMELRYNAFCERFRDLVAFADALKPRT
jgi:excisionase family DNA binding protein